MAGNILLEINTALGPGGFAAVDAMIARFGQLANTVIAGVKVMEQYTDAANALTTDISKAKEALGGAISTLDLMQTANKSAAAGLKATADQFATITKFVYNYSEATGTDAASNLEKLTMALAKGQERGLKDFNIKLKEGVSEAEQFADAMKQIEDSALSAEVAIDDISGGLEAMWNVLEDAGASMYRAAGLGESLGSSLGEAAKGMALFVSEMEKTRDGLAGAGDKGFVFLDFVKEMYLVMPGAETLAEKLGNAFRRLKNTLGLDAGDTEGKDRLAAMAAATAHRSTAAAAAFEPTLSPTDAALITGRASRRGGGGGGRRRYAGEAGDPFADLNLLGPAAAAAQQRQAEDEFFSGALTGKSEDEIRIELNLALAEATQAKIEAQQEEMTVLEEMAATTENSTQRMAAAWASAYGSMSPATLAFTGVVDGMRAATTAAMQAWIIGGKSAGEAAKQALVGVLAATAAEAAVKAIMSLANAFFAAASRQYDAAAQFTAAAGQYVAVAALAGSTAAAFASSTKGAQPTGAYNSRSAGGGGSQGYTPGPWGSGGQQQSQTTVVYVNVDGELVYESIRREDVRRAASGQSRV